MTVFSEGEKVRATIPDPEDADHRYHGETGEVVDILEDDLGGLTGNPVHNALYTIEFKDSDIKPRDFRYNDLEKL